MNAEDLHTVMILDTETSSVDAEEGQLLEVALCTFSLSHGTYRRVWSFLCHATENDAEEVNGLPPALLAACGAKEEDVVRQVSAIYSGSKCQAIVAHNAEFDRKWFPDEIQSLPWVCSCNDIEWPKKTTSRSLASLALAHGIGVSAAHRAVPDVLTLAALFSRATEMGADLRQMIARGMRPKAKFQAIVSYDTNQLAKDAGFRWEPKSKMWLRTMAIEDTADLPFSVRQISPAPEAEPTLNFQGAI